MIIKRILIGCIALALFLGNAHALQAGNLLNGQSHPTGLKPLTAVENDSIQKNWRRINKVHLNSLGQNRINKALKKRNKARSAAINTSSIVADTKDLEFQANPALSASSTVSAVALTKGTGAVATVTATLPSAVDNSQTIWFPPIGDQGNLGSCASFAITYYQLSYTQARDKNIAINTGNNNYIYSPKFVYNLVNGGQDNGSSIMAPYTLLANHGAPSMADFAYDSNYRAWPLDAKTWRNALNARTIVPGYVENLNTNTGLQQLKELLNNGHVVGFATDIFNWQYAAVKNNPNTADDDLLVGQFIAYYSKGSMYTSGHAITIVGYNDDIWTDINGNGLVEEGELGALKIANSWAATWKNSGYIWLSYDALKAVSSVSSAPSAGRNAAIWDNRGYVLLIQSNYTPKLLGEFTLNQVSRKENIIGIGRYAVNTNSYAKYTSLPAFQSNGGAFAYNGSTTAVDGTFVVDFTDALPATVAQAKYGLKISDTL
ncbi:MAG: C1 family peptidase, partial [Candidatus Omnitrophota bacterium]